MAILQSTDSVDAVDGPGPSWALGPRGLHPRSGPGGPQVKGERWGQTDIQGQRVPGVECPKEERWKNLCERLFIREAFPEAVMFVLDFKGCTGAP